MSNRSGYVAGDVIATLDDPGRGKWLNVWGSYWTAPELHATADAARADSRRGTSVAYVTEVDYPGVRRAYRITPGTLANRANPDAVPVDFDGVPVEVPASG